MGNIMVLASTGATMKIRLSRYIAPSLSSVPAVGKLKRQCNPANDEVVLRHSMRGSSQFVLAHLKYNYIS